MLRPLVLVTAILPAFVFALAGIAKLDDPLPAAVFVSRALPIRFSLALEVTRLMAAIELFVAVGLCLIVTRSVLPALAGLCLAGFSLGLLLRLTAFYPEIAACGCFGSLTGSALRRSPWMQVFIEVGLATLLAAHLLVARSYRRRLSVCADLAGDADPWAARLPRPAERPAKRVGPGRRGPSGPESPSAP